MKNVIIGVLALGSVSASAATTPYACPEKNFTIYSCKGHPKTATADEVKQFVKDLLVCYSSIDKKYTIVMKQPNDTVEVETRVKTEKSGEILGFIISNEDAVDGSAIAALEINTEVSTKNGKFTFLLPGIDMKMTCSKAR